VTFNWTSGAGVSQYFLYLGSTLQGNDIYGQSQGTNRSATVTGIPTDGRTIYVMLWSSIGGNWQTESYTYKAVNIPVPAITVTPATTVAFGSVTLGSSSTQSFTVKNTGGGTLTGTASVAAPFSIASGGSYSLAAGASQTVTVKFSPTAAQTYSQNLSFTGGAGASRTLTGTGVPAPAITVTPATTVAFGPIMIGSSSTQNLTVKNTGGGTLTGTASVASPFSIASGGSYSLAAGKSQTVVVKFAPTVAQSYSQNLTFTGGSGASRTVTGTGGAPAKITTPTPGSTLGSSSATFNWTTGTGVSQYFLYLGTTAAGNEIYGQSQGTNRSVKVTGIPTNGHTIYVMLWSSIGGNWQTESYTYKAASK
jgi:hypothetical protein